MKYALLVFFGGGMGSLLRYVLSRAWPTSEDGFPWATLAANVVACFLLGLVVAWPSREGFITEYRYLIAVGICGGLSTFSTFEYEVFRLLSSQHLILMSLYLGVSLVLGFVALWMGATAVKMF